MIRQAKPSGEVPWRAGDTLTKLRYHIGIQALPALFSQGIGLEHIEEYEYFPSLPTFNIFGQSFADRRRWSSAPA
jgi:hypothetical protein